MLRRPSVLLLAALGFALAAALIGVAALATVTGSRIDGVVLEGFTSLGGARVEALAGDAVRFVDPAGYAVLGATLMAVAIARGRPRHALVVAVVLAGAGLTAQVLKSLLAGPRPYDTPAAADIVAAAWPSGHTTGATALALCLVLVTPVRLRPYAAAAGGAFAVLIAFSLPIVGAHYPSDVLGGFCVSAAWVALGLAALRLTDARAARTVVRPRAMLIPTAVLVLAGLGAAAAFALARPEHAYAFAQAHTTFVAGAAVLAAGGLGVVASAALALRDDASRA